MLLRDEILLRENNLMQRDGFREKALYLRLVNKKSDDRLSIPTGEIDKVCYAAFVSSDLDVSKELNRELNAVPIRGAHFSNNLISVIAFSIMSEDAKKQYLQPYFDSHSLLDRFIISRFMSEFSLSDSSPGQAVIEKLIDAIFIKEDYIKGEQCIYNAFESANDLVELYVVREAYIELLKMHPNTELENNLRELDSSFKTLINRTERRINVAVNCFIVLCSIIIMPLIIFFIRRYWDDWSLEPIITGVGFCIGILSTLLLIIYNKPPNTFLEYVQLYKNRMLARWFKKRGLDLEKLRNILKEASNHI